MESFHNNQSESRENFEHKKLLVRNEIQVAIMSHLCSPDDGEDCFVRWAEDNGEKFDEIFERVLDKDPRLLDKWEGHKDLYLELFMEELKDTPRGDMPMAA